MKIYAYNKKYNSITILEDTVILDTEEMENLEAVHREDIRNTFGKIIVDNETMTPKYEPTKALIVVDKITNNFSRVQVKGEDDESKYYAEVLFKDLVNHTNIDTFNKISKFYKGKFYLFDNDRRKVYNPENNTWSYDLVEYRNYLIDIVSKSEGELRQHGFYHSLLPDGKTYLQPFRNVEKDNDHATIIGLTYLPKSIRKIKLFVEDENTGKRLTAPKTFYWVPAGKLPDVFLTAIIMLITGYSESIKAGISLMLQKIQSTSAIEELEEIEKKYKQMILLGMRKAIEGDPNNAAILQEYKEKIAKEDIELILDNNFVAGAEFNG